MCHVFYIKSKTDKILNHLLLAIKNTEKNGDSLGQTESRGKILFKKCFALLFYKRHHPSLAGRAACCPLWSSYSRRNPSWPPLFLCPLEINDFTGEDFTCTANQKKAVLSSVS
jgi:hypothetical protein